MKKILLVILAVMVMFTACGKKELSTAEIIQNHYVKILKTEDSAIIRNEITELKEMAKNTSITEEERMYAQYTYNIGYGIAKLYLSGKAISAFDFPEMEIYSAIIVSRAKNEIEITTDMVSESYKFVEKVENFLKQ